MSAFRHVDIPLVITNITSRGTAWTDQKDPLACTPTRPGSSIPRVKTGHRCAMRTATGGSYPHCVFRRPPVATDNKRRAPCSSAIPCQRFQQGRQHAPSNGEHDQDERSETCSAATLLGGHRQVIPELCGHHRPVLACRHTARVKVAIASTRDRQHRCHLQRMRTRPHAAAPLFPRTEGRLAAAAPLALFHPGATCSCVSLLTGMRMCAGPSDRNVDVCRPTLLTDPAIISCVAAAPTN
eukprot:2299732-Rhodomonas_salina.1